MNWKPSLTTVVVALGLLATANTVVGIFISSAPQSPANWLLLVGVNAGIIGLTVVQSRLDASGSTEASSQQTGSRHWLIDTVRAVWITGVLNHSLHHETLLALGLQQRPEVVGSPESPWQLALREHDQAPRPLPAGTTITTAFDAAGGALLILGEPGAGKTTLLLELARDLLDRAEAERQEPHPIPVVLNLASWAERRRPMAEWLVEELADKYWLPRGQARAWVRANALALLLDGLDEVAPAARPACIAALNAFRREHGPAPMAVCCRVADYLAAEYFAPRTSGAEREQEGRAAKAQAETEAEAAGETEREGTAHGQTERLQVTTAVEVQPLSLQQADEYLARLIGGGSQLAALREALPRDATLRELATTPLMLLTFA